MKRNKHNVSKLFTITAVTLMASGIGACADSGNDLVDNRFTAPEWEVLEGMAFVKPAPDSTNAKSDDADAAALGADLYFERSIAGPVIEDDPHGWGEVGEVPDMGCQGCHMFPWGSDDRDGDQWPTSLGAKWGHRNSPPVVNVSFYDFWYWDGSADSMWRQASAAYENSMQQNGSRLSVAHVLCDQYESRYEAVFGDLDCEDIDTMPAFGKPSKDGSPVPEWDDLTDEQKSKVNWAFINFGKAIAAYERTLVSGNSPFDQYVAGDYTALSNAQKRGAKLFVGKAGCAGCHNGPGFTDNDFYNVGVPQVGEHVKEEDTGRIGAIPKLLGSWMNVEGEYSDDPNSGKLAALNPDDQTQLGQFRTKHLRQVAETGPYMHTGAVGTLTEVVELYNEPDANGNYSGELDGNIIPLNLSSGEIADIVAFLEALTGDIPGDDTWNANKTAY